MQTIVAVDIRDRVATLTLNRPDASNALTLELARELLSAALRCEADPEIRAVVLTGAGKHFCFGGDLRAMRECGDGAPAYLNELTTHLHAAISAFTRMRAPVIAAVNGTAAGAGVGLVCAADLAVCARASRFSLAYTGVGLAPDGSVSFLLPRIVGRRRAMELLLLNRVLSAEEALAWGLVNQVVDDADLAAQTQALVDTFNSNLMFAGSSAPTALAATRTTGIGWASGRFLAGAVANTTNAGGILLELRDADLVVGNRYTFTDSGAAPGVGNVTLTIAVAGADDRAAVAWIDTRGGVREVRISTVSLTGASPLKTVMASAAGSSVTKSHPHVVFDGAAFALTWIEGDSQPNAQLKLARFDLNLTPVGTTPMNVGVSGVLGLGDIDIAAAGSNAYGIVGAGFDNTKKLFHVRCN